MVTFLTSDPLWEDETISTLNEANGFVALLRDYWKRPLHCLFIASDPVDYQSNDENRVRYGEAIMASGLPIASFDLLDARTMWMSDEQIQSYDMIMLCGGHIPTEWAWFEEIDLRHHLDHFEGILIGISAGSMNCAEEVFALPEEEGELDDPDYQWSFEGLGRVKANIIPHFQVLCDAILDGHRILEEVILPCSVGHRFLGLPDGSFVHVEDGVETVFGDAYLIMEGEISQFCTTNECREYLNYRPDRKRWGRKRKNRHRGGKKKRFLGK